MSRGAALNVVKSRATQARLIGGAMGGRERDDFYPTPPEATQALLGAETFSGPIWEPACGDGAISRVLEAAGHDVISSDLVDRGFGETRIDFLMERQLRAPTIITNPPFKLAVPFVRHSLGLGAPKVAMLLKIAFLEGVERAALFRDSPLARVHVFSKRVTFRNASRGEANGSGMMAFAWFVWDRAHVGLPTLHWLPPQPSAFNAALDCKLSYDAAIQAIGERVAAGEPLPTGGYFGGEE